MVKDAGEEPAKVEVRKEDLREYLDMRPISHDRILEKKQPGIVTGLAWTRAGGEILFVETLFTKGSGKLILTGQLGDVMKESAQIGLSYIRAISKKWGIDKEFFKENDIHIHVPEGAVPKDGPSAGITMATAMLSAATGKKVRADIAMTGEITLRGRVLPIGGLKEKLLAAKNAGIKTVCVPKKNEKDVEEVSAEITKGLEIVYVESMDEVLEQAFTA